MIKVIMLASSLTFLISCGSDKPSENNEALLEELSGMENASMEIEQEVELIEKEAENLNEELDSLLNDI